MTIPLVLLDANVLFTFALRDTILMAAERDVCRVRWSDRILVETRKNLVENGIMGDERATNLIRVMRAAFPDALVAGYEPLTAQMTNHPGDRHVAATAVHAKADAIVDIQSSPFPHGDTRSARSPRDFAGRIFARMRRCESEDDGRHHKGASGATSKTSAHRERNPRGPRMVGTPICDGDAAEF